MGGWNRRRSRPLFPSVLPPRLKPLFHFLERGGPVFAEELGERSVLEEFSCGLAARAVVGLALAVHNTLDG